MEHPQMVTDPVRNWHDMMGRCLAEKNLNGLLAGTFISPACPSDECLRYARDLLRLWRMNLEAPTFQRLVENYLVQKFGDVPNPPDVWRKTAYQVSYICALHDRRQVRA